MEASVTVHDDIALQEIVRSLALEDYSGPGSMRYESRERYAWLENVGSMIWLDTGDAQSAEKVWASQVEALTTNNTLVNQVVQTGSMDGLISYGARKIREARPDISLQDLVIEIAFLINAKLALALNEKFGAHVSVELHPDVSNDVKKTLAFARRYYDINPSYFYIKVPLTPDGFIATRRLSKDGIPVNFTLGFSARQNYFAALFSRPMFVNVFLGRLNQLVEENQLGDPQNVGEKAALSSFEAIRCVREMDRSVETLQIAASMRKGQQVVDLAGIDVLTIPPKAAQEYLDLDIRMEDIQPKSSLDLKVNLDTSKAVEVQGFSKLWDLDAQLIDFVEDAVKLADAMVTGDDLMKLASSHGVDLFSHWSQEDLEKIRNKGKISDLSQWPGVAIDELMSMSALQSFAKDQEELDGRIEDIIGEAG